MLRSNGVGDIGLAKAVVEAAAAIAPGSDEGGVVWEEGMMTVLEDEDNVDETDCGGAKPKARRDTDDRVRSEERSWRSWRRWWRWRRWRRGSEIVPAETKAIPGR